MWTFISLSYFSLSVLTLSYYQFLEALCDYINPKYPRALSESKLVYEAPSKLAAEQGAKTQRSKTF